VHSAMNIKEAYRLCPHGVYMHPNFEKYRAVSQRLHEIWDSYAAVSETIALDEAYLDVTESAPLPFDGRSFRHLLCTDGGLVLCPSSGLEIVVR